jgi:hypothetical protein
MNARKTKRFEIGDRVITLVPLELYYSHGYAPKGTKGVIIINKVPSVIRERITFNCVDITWLEKKDRVAALNSEIKHTK